MPIFRRPRAVRNPHAQSFGVTFTLGAEAANARTVSVQLQDRAADAGERTPVLAYLSSDANGDTVHKFAPNGGWAGGTDGSLIASVTTNKVAHWITEADGDLDVVITDTGAYTCYLNVLIGGRKFTSPAVAFA